jgi:excisionase family DNA binding protein
MALSTKVCKNSQQHTPLEELFSVRETARKLGGVSLWTVRAWISQGRLEKTKVGSRTMITARAIGDFLNDCADREARRNARKF